MTVRSSEICRKDGSRGFLSFYELLRATLEVTTVKHRFSGPAIRTLPILLCSRRSWYLLNFVFFLPSRMCDSDCLSTTPWDRDWMFILYWFRDYRLKKKNIEKILWNRKGKLYTWKRYFFFCVLYFYDIY